MILISPKVSSTITGFFEVALMFVVGLIVASGLKVIGGLLIGLKESFLKKNFYNLSLGERQRVVIARSLINEPNLLN